MSSFGLPPAYFIDRALSELVRRHPRGGTHLEAALRDAITAGWNARDGAIVTVITFACERCGHIHGASETSRYQLRSFECDEIGEIAACLHRRFAKEGPAT